MSHLPAQPHHLVMIPSQTIMSPCHITTSCPPFHPPPHYHAMRQCHHLWSWQTELIPEYCISVSHGNRSAIIKLFLTRHYSLMALPTLYCHSFHMCVADKIFELVTWKVSFYDWQKYQYILIPLQQTEVTKDCNTENQTMTVYFHTCHRPAWKVMMYDRVLWKSWIIRNVDGQLYNDAQFIMRAKMDRREGNGMEGKGCELHMVMRAKVRWCWPKQIWWR